MLLEVFPFVILNNAMAFVYAYFFSDFLRIDIDCYPVGVSNKHCLFCLLFFIFPNNRSISIMISTHKPDGIMLNTI